MASMLGRLPYTLPYNGARVHSPTGVIVGPDGPEPLVTRNEKSRGNRHGSGSDEVIVAT